MAFFTKYVLNDFNCTCENKLKSTLLSSGEYVWVGGIHRNVSADDVNCKRCLILIYFWSLGIGQDRMKERMLEGTRLGRN